MLSDEEKKEIKKIKKEFEKNHILPDIANEDLGILLNLIEKQQKEIQDLIINQCIYQGTSSCTRSISLKMYTELNNYIRKDKIKPIQIIDLDGKIHNVYKIEEE